MSGQAHSLTLLRPSDQADAMWSQREPGPDEATLQVVLVTDLVAFTPLLVRKGDNEALRLMRLHNAVLRECFRRHGGREIAHTGDGMMCAFRSVRRSLACAVDIQRRLAAHSAEYPDAQLQARVGLHVGEPLPEEGRLFGSCVNAAVRICAAAGPGCILVSEMLKQIAHSQRLTFLDRGSVALKGLEEPLRLYELDVSSFAAVGGIR